MLEYIGRMVSTFGVVGCIYEGDFVQGVSIIMQWTGLLDWPNYLIYV